MNPESEQQTPPNPPEATIPANPRPVGPAQPDPTGVHKVFPTFIGAANKLNNSKRKPLNRRRVIIEIVVGVLLFFAGYQLAISQIDNDKSLFPHFTIGKSHHDYTCSQNYFSGQCGHPLGCGTMNAEYGICNISEKPVVYLYPKITQQVNVREAYITGFSTTEPAYNPQTGWNVIAQPDGTLKNTADNKSYPYLYWEGNPARLNFDMTAGFSIAGKNTRSFLEKQLPSMGLNESEKSAFIEYWLPRMEHNTYNRIHFAGSEYTKLAPLRVSPKPDSTLRVYMAFQPSNGPEAMKPQQFPVFHRDGFTVVEWGGAELH